MSGFAQARRDGVLIERLGDEIVLYDRDADVAHCLQAAVAAVWEQADGTRSEAQIAAAAGVEEREVSDALEQLRQAGLLDEREPGHTRREATKRILRTGALAAAAPLIYTVAIAPAAAMASGDVCFTAATSCFGQNVDQATAQAQADEACNTQCPYCDGGEGGIQVGPPGDQTWIVTGLCTT
jgi:hypothetical protein